MRLRIRRTFHHAVWIKRIHRGGQIMISQECYELGSKSSVIREIFSYGLKRKAEIGEDKVYDFSLGNPSIPAPESVKSPRIFSGTG